MAAIEIKPCFISGAATFLLNAFLLLTPIGIITAIILPGFIFGFILIDNKQHISIGRKIAFLIISGVLYIAAAFLVTGHAFSWQKELYTFSIASVAGAVALLIAYKFLLDKSIFLYKGIPLAIGTGLLSALLPTIAMSNIFGISDWFGIIGSISVYVTWQTSFGWVLSKVQAPISVSITPISS